MITGQLTTSQQHHTLHPAFSAAFAFLSQSNLTTLPISRYPLDGENLFVIISTDEGRTRSGAKLEAHRRYIDIQYVIEGREVMGISPLSECNNPLSDFDTQKDIIFFSDPPREWITLDPGAYVILYPNDAHAHLAGTGTVRKAIVKVAVDHDKPQA